MALTVKERGLQLRDKIAGSSLVVKASTLYESMSPRDQRLFWMLIGFFCLLSVGGAAYTGRNYLKGLEQQLQRQKDSLARVEEVRSEHETLKAQIEKIEDQLKNDPDFNLTSFLEKSATKVGFTEAAGIQSKGETVEEGFKSVSVEVRLRKAPLDKLVQYLYEIEAAPQRLTVKKLRVYTSFGSRSELNAELEVTAMTPQES